MLKGGRMRDNKCIYYQWLDVSKHPSEELIPCPPQKIDELLQKTPSDIVNN